MRRLGHGAEDAVFQGLCRLRPLSGAEALDQETLASETLPALKRKKLDETMKETMKQLQKCR